VKILVDMNLTPRWVEFFATRGGTATALLEPQPLLSQSGGGYRRPSSPPVSSRAKSRDLLPSAREGDPSTALGMTRAARIALPRFVVFTHDLDFGNILAVTHVRTE